MKLKMLGCFVCLLVGGWTSIAQARISNLRYYPYPLYTDDPQIKFTWTADRNLPRKYIYEIRIRITSEKSKCDNASEGNSENAPKRGHHVTVSVFYFLHEWCNGRVVMQLGYTKESLPPKCKEERKKILNEETGEEETKLEEVCEEAKSYPFHVLLESEFRILKKP